MVWLNESRIELTGPDGARPWILQLDDASAPIGRSELARSSATRAPASIGHAQVLEHALRHLAWLSQDDEAVAARLSAGWRAALGDYVPEPFRSLA